MNLLLPMIIPMMGLALSVDQPPTNYEAQLENLSRDALTLWLVESMKIENMITSLHKKTTKQFENLFRESIRTCDPKSLKRLSHQWAYEVRRYALKLCETKVPNIIDRPKVLLEIAVGHFPLDKIPADCNTDTNELICNEDSRYRRQIETTIEEKKQEILQYRKTSMIDQWNTIGQCFEDLSWSLKGVLSNVKLPSTINQWDNCFKGFIRQIRIPLFGRRDYIDWANNFTGSDVSIENRFYRFHEKQWKNERFRVPPDYPRLCEEIMSKEEYRIYDILGTVDRIRNGSEYLNNQHSQYPVAEMMWHQTVSSIMHTTLKKIQDNKITDAEGVIDDRTKSLGIDIRIRTEIQGYLNHFFQTMNSIRVDEQSLRNYEKLMAPHSA